MNEHYETIFEQSKYSLRKCKTSQKLSVWKGCTGIPVSEFNEGPAIKQWIEKNNWQDVKEFLWLLRMLGLIGEILNE